MFVRDSTTVKMASAECGGLSNVTAGERGPTVLWDQLISEQSCYTSEVFTDDGGSTKSLLKLTLEYPAVVTGVTIVFPPGKAIRF